MGYFEAAVEPLFKTTTSGQRCFFPLGMFGRGRILPDVQTEHSVRRIAKIYYNLSLVPIALLILERVDWLGLCGIVAGMTAIYRAVIYVRVRDLPFADERMRWSEAYRRSARGMGKRPLLGFCLGCTALAGLALVVAATTTAGWPIIWPVMAFAGGMLILAVLYGWLARVAAQEGE